jgi:Domain of unknown function (DUF4282)
MAAISENCQSCGQPLPAGTAICVHCGGQVADAVGAPQSGPITTPPTMGAASTPPPPTGAASPPPYTPPAAMPTGVGAPGLASHAPLTHRGFLASLFDLSFTSLVATKIIRVLYAITIALIGLLALLFVLAAFHQSSTDGVIVLFIAAPLVSLFYLVYARVILEIFIALFRIMENTSELVAQGRQRG